MGAHLYGLMGSSAEKEGPCYKAQVAGAPHPPFLGRLPRSSGLCEWHQVAMWALGPPTSSCTDALCFVPQDARAGQVFRLGAR